MNFKLTYATMFDPPEELHQRFEAAMARARGQLGRRHPLYLAGEDRDTPAALRKLNPANDQQLLGEFAAATRADADAAPVVLGRFEDLLALAADRRDLQTKAALERDVRLVRFEPGRLEIALEPNAAKALVGELARKISEWTGQRWMVVVSGEQGQPTIRSQNEARRADFERGVQADPLVKAVLARFPGAQIVAVREGPQEVAPPSAEGDVMPPEPPIDDDASAFAEHMRPDDMDEES